MGTQKEYVDEEFIAKVIYVDFNAQYRHIRQDYDYYNVYDEPAHIFNHKSPIYEILEKDTPVKS